jgi:hypothetical protein
MHSYVQLFDLLSGNVIADFPDERAAWAALRQAALEFGAAELNGLGLTQMRNGRPTLLAMEDELVRRATGSASRHHIRSSGRISASGSIETATSTISAKARILGATNVAGRWQFFASINRSREPHVTAPAISRATALERVA